MYEYVPGTTSPISRRSIRLTTFRRKNLLTYPFGPNCLSNSQWAVLQLAGSDFGAELPCGAVQTLARDFAPGVHALFWHSDAAVAAGDGAGAGAENFRPLDAGGNRQYGARIFPSSRATMTLSKNVVGGQTLPPTNSYLTVDAFFDPYRGTFSQWNTDFRVQQSNYWYLEVGQRFSLTVTGSGAATFGIRSHSMRSMLPRMKSNSSRQGQVSGRPGDGPSVQKAITISKAAAVRNTMWWRCIKILASVGRSGCTTCSSRTARAIPSC